MNPLPYREVTKSITVIFSLLLSATFMGCSSSGYKQFYSQAAPSVYKTSESVQVFEYADVELREVYDLLFSEYIIIGNSSFNGPYERPINSTTFAKSIGADIFLATSQFKETKNSAVGMTTPTVSTSYVSGYSAGGSFGGTVTTYGTQTTMIPVSVNRYDQDGIFLKNINNVSPFWLKKSFDFPISGTGLFDGIWQNDTYIIRIYQSNDTCVGSIEKFKGKGSKGAGNWASGDVKFTIKKNSKFGVYLMGDRTPQPATFAINKFGHLEVVLVLVGERFSFEKLNN